MLVLIVLPPFAHTLCPSPDWIQFYSNHVVPAILRKEGRTLSGPTRSLQVLCLRQLVVVQSLSPIQLSVTPWTAARQASLSFSISHSLLRLTSIESVMASNHFIICRPFSRPQSFPASRSFPRTQFFTSGGQSTGASASASVLLVNIQAWFPLGLTGLIS